METKKHVHVVFKRSVRIAAFLILYHDLPTSTDFEHTKLVFYFDVVYTLHRVSRHSSVTNN
jgi:hypothetical protein